MMRRRMIQKNRSQQSNFRLRRVVVRYPAFALIMIVCLLTACGPLTIRQQESLYPSPVAFVTAGPLPEPSATPTQPPLTKPTVIPPTVVPKKMPLESTSAIGLWSDKIASTQSFTGVVDIATGDAALALQMTNLALLSLNKRQVYYGISGTITDVLANHATWVLYDKTGKVAYSSTDHPEPLLNIRDSDVITQLASDVYRLVNDGHYDGILIEGAGNDLIRADNSPVYTGTATFTDQQRRDSVEGLLRAIRARIPGKLMIIGGYAWEDGTAYSVKPSVSQDLASIGDGIHIEKFLRAPISSTTDYKSESSWKKDIDYLSAISQDGKIVLISTRFVTTDVPTDSAKVWLDYSVASYLLGKNGSSTYFQFDFGGSLAYTYDPMLAAPIGAPQEAYTKLSSGLYRRLFSKGIALVNPTTEKKDTNFDTAYHALGASEPITKVVMPPHTGLILLKP
jgi:hypothetical protein